MKWLDSVKNTRWYIRLTNWEYWPSEAFYWPMFIAGPLLALRSRHPVFFTSANPGILAGGLGLESKYRTIQKIPETWRPRSILVTAGSDFGRVQEQLRRADLHFPLIAKPDRGFRGLLVRKIASEEELAAYLRRYSVSFIVQEFIGYPEEIGVLYYRMPGAERGHITSLTFKDFLHVTGDGRASVGELIERQPRARLQWERLKAEYAGLLACVPAPGEFVPLGVIGNHSKGTRFINANAFIDPTLEATFDRIADRIDGFFYGRFDIKCRSFDDLRQERHFAIIELNGVCSEPTHIYDSDSTTYFGALRDILRHWLLIRRIAARNHARGVPYMSARTMIRELKELSAYLKNLKGPINT